MFGARCLSGAALKGQLAQLAAERGEAATAVKRGSEENARLEKQLVDARRKVRRPLVYLRTTSYHIILLYQYIMSGFHLAPSCVSEVDDEIVTVWGVAARGYNEIEL